MSEPFLRMSEVLTGVSRLPQAHADELLLRLEGHYKTEVDELLSAYVHRRSAHPAEPSEDSVRALLDAQGEQQDGRHRAVLAIVSAWYTGQFPVPHELPGSPTRPAHYANGLLWRVIGAHAPGFTNANYAAWAERPVAEEE